MYLEILGKTYLPLECCEIINQYANTDIYLEIYMNKNDYEFSAKCLLHKNTWKLIQTISKNISDEPFECTGYSHNRMAKITKPNTTIGDIMKIINTSDDKVKIRAFKTLYGNRRFVGSYDIIREIYNKCIIYKKNHRP